jgi:hypothetical protein
MNCAPTRGPPSPPSSPAASTCASCRATIPTWCGASARRSASRPTTPSAASRPKTNATPWPLSSPAATATAPS